MKALIIGATGATGKDLVNILLQDPYYSEVIIFVRRLSGVVRPKLFEILTDFDKLARVAEFIKGDILFSCLGTTLKAAGSKEKQWEIDYEIPFQFAEIARRNGVLKVVLLSAHGASATSRVFYSQIKGKLEQAMDRLQYNQFIIFRPGILQRKDTDRMGELISISVIKILNSLGIIKKFRPLPTSTLAEKMAKAPKVLLAGKHEIELDKIFGF
jgi:uncharacterized protein YbjT (DUF2867 family)